MRTLTPTGRPLSDIFPGKSMFPCEQPLVLRRLFHYSRMKSAPRKPRSRNNCAPKYSKIHGIIRRHSGLSKLRKPISAFLYSRLLTWANAIEKGLNPPRSFNSVSTVRNRPSGDPNCELFPQGPIIPVPPSTPPYRPVGACGNNRTVSPGKHAKRKPPNQKVRRPLFPLFRWRLCSMAAPKQHQAVLGSTKTRVQKPVPAIPTQWLKTISSLFQFAAVCSSSSHLHPVSKFAANPWGQIWVTDFQATCSNFAGHSGSQQAASSTE